MAKFDEKDYERTFPRETIRTKAEITIDGKRYDCVITNISPAGTRLYKKLDVSRDQPARIKIGEHGEFNATVAWCNGDEFGLWFEDDMSALADMLVKSVKI